MSNHPHKAEEAGWPVVWLVRPPEPEWGLKHLPYDGWYPETPASKVGAYDEVMRYLPETSIQGLVGRLEEIADNFENMRFLAEQESISLGAEGNHLGEHEAKGIASAARSGRDNIRAALASFNQKVE